MKKILVINTKYKIFGGEDSNIIEELAFLKNYYNTYYLEFDNSKRLNFFDCLALFTNSNIKSNKIVKQKLLNFDPDIVYVHNTWFKANLGIFKILEKQDIPILLKIHNFRFDCTNTFLLRKHIKSEAFCPKCGLEITSRKYFNKYFSESIAKSFFINLYGRKYFNILKKNNLKIVVLNKFYLEYLKNLNINRKKIQIGYNPTKISTHKTYDSNSNYVVYAGNLSRAKGLKELLETWVITNNQLKLYLIGTGELEYELSAKFANDSIVFTGAKKNNEVLEIIRNSRAVITATKMFEGQPRLLCEASSNGIPSIYPSYGGMDEFFPPEYKFSFEQFNYLDLKNKIHDLNNQNLLNIESKRVQNFISEKLKYEKLIQNFEKLI